MPALAPKSGIYSRWCSVFCRLSTTVHTGNPTSPCCAAPPCRVVLLPLLPACAAERRTWMRCCRRQPSLPMWARESWQQRRTCRWVRAHWVWLGQLQKKLQWMCSNVGMAHDLGLSCSTGRVVCHSPLHRPTLRDLSSNVTRCHLAQGVVGVTSLPTAQGLSAFSERGIVLSTPTARTVCRVLTCTGEQQINLNPNR